MAFGDQLNDSEDAKNRPTTALQWPTPEEVRENGAQAGQYANNGVLKGFKTAALKGVLTIDRQAPQPEALASPDRRGPDVRFIVRNRRAAAKYLGAAGAGGD